MTMYTLPNFCRVCLKYDKNLIDLEHIENEPNETLMSKLQHCVSEVEWKVFKPLLCHPCIKRLNIAYTFKKQCVQSATMLKSYMALLSKNKPEEQNSKSADITQSGAYMMLPNQKYIKIVVGPQNNQNTYQNVFLNVVPTTTISPVTSDSKTSSKDNNQNVFLNINNTFQKYVPVTSETPQKNVDELLTESKTEELSVEIDPMDFGLGDDAPSEEDSENGVNDWEDVISAMKVSNGKPNGKHIEPKTSFTNFVPILPKQTDDKIDFSSSGEHFLSSSLYSQPMEFTCEQCQKQFTSRIYLRNHIKNFHMGKLPFKCDYCSNEFMVRFEYEVCMKYHKQEEDPLSTSITLNDLKKESVPLNDKSDSTEEIISPTDLTCDICQRQFNSPSGMLRHKVRKHNQKSKKKYFIKGMKNAKCDICNREFSTQSYMQLHRKLHLRDDIGYKYKVLGKSRYMKRDESKNNEEKNDSDEEKIAEKSYDLDDSNKDDNVMNVGIKNESVDIKDEDDDESNSDNGSEN